MDNDDLTAKAEDIARNCLGTRIRLISRAVTQLYDEALKPHGITLTQVTILAHLIANDGLTYADLAVNLRMDASSLSRTAARMIERGWVVKEPGEGRRRRLGVTSVGREAFTNAFPTWRRAQEACRERLGMEGVVATHLITTTLTEDA